jgi:hypothetical protein
MCYDNCDFPSFLNKYPSNFIINLTLLKYCDRLLKNIKKPIIIILQSLFSERKRRKWIKVNELKLLIEIFSDVNEDIMTAKEFDETSEKYLDDVTDFILEGKRKEKEKEKKKNSHKEMLLNDLTVVIITRIYKTIMESSNEEYKKRLSKRIEDKNIIIRIIRLLEMKDESLYIKNYYNMLRLVLNEYEEISEEKRFKEIIIPMLDFIKKHYMNGRCDSSSSSSSSSPLSGCVSMSVVSDGIISTSLEVLLYYVKEEDSERQPRLLESEIIEVLFPLMIHSSSSNVKRCISRIIRILCENERNKKDLIYKCKICEYFKLILTLLYKKLNIVVKEEESDLQTNQNDDQVKYYVYNNRDNECEMCVYDYTKHIEQIIFSFKLLSSSEMDESSFPWRYTSLCCLYLSLETLSNFVCGLMNLLQFKVESGILDQAEEKFVKEVINSFDILQKILEIPKIVFILREFKEQLPFLLVYSISIEIIGRYILVCWKISPDDDQAKSMIFLSLLNFSMECVKSSLFVYFPLDVKVEIYHFVCAMMHDIVDSKIEESNKYPDLIRSYFDKSGWTEWLIHIFNTLKAFPSSPHSDSDLIPSLSFFSSVSSSEYTHTIIYLTAKTIEMLLKSNTPKAVVEYLELT